MASLEVEIKDIDESKCMECVVSRCMVSVDTATLFFQSLIVYLKERLN